MSNSPKDSTSLRTTKMSTKNHSQNRKNEDFEPVVPLVPPKPTSDTEDRSNFITFEVKVIAGSESAGKFKKNVWLFDDGTPDEFIKLLDDLHNIYKQNKIDDAADQNALVESILKGNLKENYLSFMEEIHGVNEEGNLNNITKEMLDQAIDKMKMEIFP